MYDYLINILGDLEDEVDTLPNVSNPLRIAIQAQFDHYTRVLQGQPDNASPSANAYEPPMHRNPRSTIRQTVRMHKLVKIASDMAPQIQARAQFQKIMSIFDGANALKLLHRFVDRRQAVMNKPFRANDPKHIMSYFVNPSQHKQFAHELQLQKVFVRLLHLRGLTRFLGVGVKMDSSYLYDLCTIYRVARLLLEEEVTRISPDEQLDIYEIHAAKDDPAYSSFAWVEPTRLRLWLTLRDMTEIAFEPRQSLAARFLSAPAAEMTEDQLVVANLSDPAVLDKMIACYEEIMTPYPADRLVVDLLAKEDRFEKALTVEHVEDRLINKQVATKDESSFVRNTTRPNSVMKFSDGRDTNESNIWAFIYEILQDIALVNRQRRNHRLIRDWQGENRPWKGMFHLYDSSSPRNEWITEGCKEFYRHTTTPWDINPNYRSLSRDGPSSYKNILEYLPAIKPFDYTPVTAQRLEPALGSSCKLCHQAWVGGDSMDHTGVTLHCHHSFHLKCVFKYWDAPGRYLHTCPTCKKAPRMNWQILGIDPNDPCIAPDFYHNLFGWNQAGKYADSDDPKERMKYDVPVRPTDLGQIDRTGPGSYWARENMYVAMLAEQAEFISWDGGFMNARGLPPRVPSRDVNLMRGRLFTAQPAPTDRELVLRGVSLMSQRWMATYQGANRRPIGTGTVDLPPVRFHPRSELAYLRMRRRRRDVKRRAAFEAAGMGLNSLFS